MSDSQRDSRLEEILEIYQELELADPEARRRYQELAEFSKPIIEWPEWTRRLDNYQISNNHTGATVHRRDA